MKLRYALACAAAWALSCADVSAACFWRYVPGVGTERCKELEAAKKMGEAGFDLAKELAGAPREFKPWQKAVYGQAIFAIARRLTPPGARVERCLDLARPVVREFFGKGGGPDAFQQGANWIALGLVSIQLTRQLQDGELCKYGLIAKQHDADPNADRIIAEYCVGKYDVQQLSAFNDWLQAQVGQQLNGCGQR